MTSENKLVAGLELALKSRGFTTARDLILHDARFDLVGEDEARLLFIEVRQENFGWIDDFYDKQAALAATLRSIDLGQKWRDVYMLEITTDAIDTESELVASQAIQADTSIARKLVIDAAAVNPDDMNDLNNLLDIVLAAPDVRAVHGDIDVLGALAENLVAGGFDEKLVERLMSQHNENKHDCVETLLRHVENET